MPYLAEDRTKRFRFILAACDANNRISQQWFTSLGSHWLLVDNPVQSNNRINVRRQSTEDWAFCPQYKYQARKGSGAWLWLGTGVLSAQSSSLLGGSAVQSPQCTPGQCLSTLLSLRCLQQAAWQHQSLQSGPRSGQIRILWTVTGYISHNNPDTLSHILLNSQALLVILFWSFTSCSAHILTFAIAAFIFKDYWTLLKYYRVFTAIGKQEGGCYKLILSLLTAKRASMSPQDWAQITFRSEMHLNDFNN